MKTITVLIPITFALLSLAGCKSKAIYVPVESVRTEYKDRLQRDSIFMQDSVFVDRWMKNDTVFLTKEKYKYLYRDRLQIDSFIRRDTIAVPYPVVEEKEINRLSSFQAFQIWCGRIVLLTAILFIIQKVIRKKLNFKL